MTITYQIGDLTRAPEPIIVHGCNAQGVMRSGVAKAIRQKWPEAFTAYRDLYYKQGNRLDLGQVAWAAADGKYIGNAITQEFYGRDGKRYVDYDAIDRAFYTIRRFTEQYQMTDVSDYSGPYVAIPRIGAGLGGGDWNEIEARILAAMEDVHIVVYDLP